MKVVFFLFASVMISMPLNAATHPGGVTATSQAYKQYEGMREGEMLAVFADMKKQLAELDRQSKAKETKPLDMSFWKANSKGMRHKLSHLRPDQNGAVLMFYRTLEDMDKSQAPDSRELVKQYLEEQLKRSGLDRLMEPRKR